MKCPSCHRPVDEEAVSCYSCGYGILHARAEFGARQVRLKRVQDTADCLLVEETRHILQTIDQLEETFPQISFIVFIGELEGSSISELGFWLINHARVDDLEIARPNETMVLLIVDIEQKRAGISLGYFAEMLLSEEDSLRALMAGRSHLINEEFGDGTVAILRKLGKQLRHCARKLKGLSRDQQRLRLLEERRFNSLALPPHFVNPHFAEEPSEVLDALPKRPISVRRP